ncbi:MAG TPA: hypothetical protein VGH79_08430 [Gaiellaceae bacterium]|jgi:hypothetical protein
MSNPPDLPELPIDRLLVWSGAGISAELPTGAPLAWELTRNTLEHCFLPETGPLLTRYYRALRLERTAPRLETLLEVVQRVHGIEMVADLLSDLVDARPNAIHKLLAAMTDCGARQVTANFDACLESAGASDVFHFHGSLADDPSAEKLGATLARIERGFPADVRDTLDQDLGWCKAMLFVGYSGSDFFDVVPYFASLPADKLAGRRVLWLEHSDGPRVILDGEAAAQRGNLGSLREAGADVYVVSGPSRETLDELSESWGLPTVAPPYGARGSWSAAREADPGSLGLASLELYSLMGLNREIERLLESAALDPKRAAALLGDVRWFQGRYRAAARARRIAGVNSREAQRPVELWIRGQYVRARRAAIRAVKRADATVGTASERPLEERLVRAETLARLWQHMRRVWDVRFLATNRLASFALEHLPDPAELALKGHPLGTHLAVRVRGARAALGASSARASDSVVAFGEYEALGAWLNYRHGQLRAKAEGTDVEASEYRLLRDDHLILGADGDAARVLFLPGAAAVFSWRELAAALRTLDVTPWHRARLASWYAARRLSARLARAARTF